MYAKYQLEVELGLPGMQDNSWYAEPIITHDYGHMISNVHSGGGRGREIIISLHYTYISYVHHLCTLFIITNPH